MPERVYTRQVVDDYNDAKKAIRSMIVYQACRLAENGEECFVVTATNPNILGSDKGVAYCGILFQGIQRAFSRHVEAHQTADRDQAVEQGPETSTEDVHSVHSKLQTHLKIENPIRHESENDHCGNNSNDKGEPCPTPRKGETSALSRNVSPSQWNGRGKQPLKDNNTPAKMDIQSMFSYSDDSDLLGSGTDEDSTNADSLLSESELLAESSKWETTGLKRTNQMDEVNSDKKRFKPGNGINLNTVGPSTSGLQSTSQMNKEDKRFVCVVKGCEKGHKDRSKQLEHYISHTDMKLYTCDLCQISFKTRGSVCNHRKQKHPDIEYRPQVMLRERLEELEKELERNNDVSTLYNPDVRSNENMPKQRNRFCGVYLPGLHDDQDSVQ
ncbi:uncharacterized protein LOC128211913 isoform X2 [Mya arenaria]|nr:uncharacterized protein LOC128211913 isoform X2 [Mya arenaria]